MLFFIKIGMTHNILQGPLISVPAQTIGDRIPAGEEIFLFATATKRPLGNIRSPITWVLEPISPRVRLELESYSSKISFYQSNHHSHGL
jgi:hypothetical protein